MPKGIYKHKSNQGFQKGHKIGIGNKNNFGKKIYYSEEDKIKMREKMTGENNPLWKGGISKDRREYFVKRLEKIAGRKRPNNCELCGSVGKICLDHDHTTGKFRGWICNRCNVTLGNVKDDTILLIAMINYLKSRI